jgi:hypothetical protein
MAAVRARIANRATAFLEMVEYAIFAQADSPYRALLQAAGYDLLRIRALVAREGVEATLRSLYEHGVYISIEEFKGLREAARGERRFRFVERDFRNPLVGPGLVARSGGTTGPGTRTVIGAANHRAEAERLAVAVAAYGLVGRPIAVWLPAAHGASAWAVLALAAMRQAPARWFTQLPGRSRPYNGFRVAARLRGIRLPPTMEAPFGDVREPLRWVTQASCRVGCGIFTTPSSALRLALSAARSHVSLANLTLITIGEPLTSTKLAAIQQVGARAFSSLGFTEFGRATYGCAAPATADDSHICRDGVAVIHRRRSVDRLGAEVDALLFTALQRNARRILLNVETGDYATRRIRQCGCLLEEVGWTEHLEGIRSFEKLNSEGPVFWGTQLISLVEETLPARFGGDPTDYQLVEREDEYGFTRLDIRVHPRLTGVNEQAVLDCVREALRAHNPRAATIWEKTSVLRVDRAVPMLTGAGKLMPLHHLGLPIAPTHGA